MDACQKTEMIVRLMTSLMRTLYHSDPDAMLKIHQAIALATHPVISNDSGSYRVAVVSSSQKIDPAQAN